MEDNVSKRAFIFPGQASQFQGMGKELFQKYPVCREIFEKADEALGFSISQLCFQGPEEKLQLTENTQPAILTVSVAAWKLLENHGYKPDFVAGHSLGEYSALVAAGAITLEDAVVVVRKRGQFMQQAVPINQGKMAAIIGANREEVEMICTEAAQGEVLAPANYNSPVQTVISGSATAVDRAVKLARDRGIRQAIILPVSAPFHCSLMEPAQKKLAVELDKIEFKDLAFPLVTNVDAEPITKGEKARACLIRQVTSPVRWVESINRLIEDGVSRFVEVGPGQVLSKLIRRIDKSVKSLQVGDESSFKILGETLPPDAEE
jgi:[acyl-carrier-protein] S-malonyltransferase